MIQYRSERYRFFYYCNFMPERKPALAENWQKLVFMGVFGTCALHLHNHYYPVSSNS